jgi:hypothetical protein
MKLLDNSILTFWADRALWLHVLLILSIGRSASNPPSLRMFTRPIGCNGLACDYSELSP